MIEVTIVDVLVGDTVVTGNGYEKELQGVGRVLLYYLDACYIGVLFMKTCNGVQYTYVYTMLKSKVENGKIEKLNWIFFDLSYWFQTSCNATILGFSMQQSSMKMCLGSSFECLDQSFQFKSQRPLIPVKPIVPPSGFLLGSHLMSQLPHLSNSLSTSGHLSSTFLQ